VEARSIITATFSQPVTASRQEQGRSIAAWLNDWLPAALAAAAKAESVK
jgi:hypothetical protein